MAKKETRVIVKKGGGKELIPRPDTRTERDIAIDFATAVHKKFNAIVKASVLFGSQTKETSGPNSDIDIILIVDDASIKWDAELTAWYREELAKIIPMINSKKELHINTVKLTTWWQDLMYGDPVVINILRYGESLIDIGGFFNPLKALLLQGKIHSTPEAVYAALQRAPFHLARSKSAELNSIEGVYWCMVDSAQAALMTAGKMPPSPEHIPLLLEEEFESRGLLKRSYIKEMEQIFNLHKSILHGKTPIINGSEVEYWQKSAERFMSEMTKIIDIYLEAQKLKK